SGLVSSTLTECRQNQTVNVYFGMLDSAGAIIVDPLKCFGGTMDVPTVQDNGPSVTISITAENPLIGLQRASQRRYTLDDSQIDYPTDTGFSFVPQIQSWDGTWGKAG